MLAPMKYGIAPFTNDETEATLAIPTPLTTAQPTQHEPPTSPHPAPDPTEWRWGHTQEMTGSARNRDVIPALAAICWLVLDVTVSASAWVLNVILPVELSARRSLTGGPSASSRPWRRRRRSRRPRPGRCRA